MTPDEIRRVLEFYQDLGIKTIYRRGSQLAPVPAEAASAPAASAAAAAPVESYSWDDLPPLPAKAGRPQSPAPAPTAAPAPSWDDLPPLPPKATRPQPPAPPQRPQSPPPAPSWDDLPPAPRTQQRPPVPPPAAAAAPVESYSWDDLPPLPPKASRPQPPAPPQRPQSPPPSAPAWDDLPPAPRVIQPPPPSAPDMIDLLPLAPDNDSLAQIRTDIGDCRRCRLCEQRNKIVFGSGNEQSSLVFVGEGPGADEDASGLPFVGRAGQLLTQMIEGTASKEGIAIKRPDVYICNVVKCRPPENRTPQPDEMEICGQFLFRQLSAIKPKAICALGSTAAKALLGTKDGVTKLRGNWQKWRGIPVMVTYHPSYLLRPYNQNAKREAWEDLKKVLHFVYD